MLSLGDSVVASREQSQNQAIKGEVVEQRGKATERANDERKRTKESRRVANRERRDMKKLERGLQGLGLSSESANEHGAQGSRPSRARVYRANPVRTKNERRDRISNDTRKRMEEIARAQGQSVGQFWKSYGKAKKEIKRSRKKANDPTPVLGIHVEQYKVMLKARWEATEAERLRDQEERRKAAEEDAADLQELRQATMFAETNLREEKQHSYEVQEAMAKLEI
ncbi:hypothetical protein BDV95DRAFT_561297 [Massariosphaeria phaeospora]|uniref:Uncharacterized protein n=1 Tax=Massariosphaeria phaeospora TaxID=100035 RepID=A0A7C8MM18_9PLEO|nr:hypothetical protein BDV95DRAFT_561297 [Massariosphaeria phaeospora]